MATLMDGKATLNDILGELSGRIEKLVLAGITPGLGTVLVGDDPGSHSYVRGKHRDCAQVGIGSLQRELPADATQADVERAIDELNADPTCTGFIVQLPLPRGLDAGAALERVDPAKDADGLHPVSLGRLVLNVNAPMSSPLPYLPTAMGWRIRSDSGPAAGFMSVSMAPGCNGAPCRSTSGERMPGISRAGRRFTYWSNSRRNFSSEPHSETWSGTVSGQPTAPK